MPDIDSLPVPSPDIYFGGPQTDATQGTDLTRTTTNVDTGDIIRDTQSKAEGGKAPSSDYTLPADVPGLAKPESKEGKVIPSDTPASAAKTGADVASGADAQTKTSDAEGEGAQVQGDSSNGEAEASLFTAPKGTGGSGENGSGSGGGGGSGSGSQNGSSEGSTAKKTGEASSGGSGVQEASTEAGSAAQGEGDSARGETKVKSGSAEGSSSTGVDAGSSGSGSSKISGKNSADSSQGVSSGGTSNPSGVEESSLAAASSLLDVGGELTSEQKIMFDAIKSGQLGATGGPDPKVIQSLSNSATTLDNLIKEAANIVSGLPETPAKASFKDFLAEISKALIEFTTLLYQLQGEDLKQAKRSAQVQMEASADQIENRRKQEHDRIKAEKKKRSKAKLGILGKIFSFVKIAFLAIAAAVVQMVPGLGQVAGAFIVSAMVDEFCKTFGIKFSMTQLMMKGITEMVAAIAEKMIPGISEETLNNIRTGAKAFVAAINIAAMVLSPVSFALGGGAIIQSTLLDSGLITDPKLKQILGITLMAAQFTATVIMTVVMMLIPGAQGAAVANMTQAGMNIMDKAKKIADIVEIVASVTQAVVSVTQGINNALIADLNRKLKLALGDLEYSLSLIQTLIKMMKDLITKLQESISDYSKQINVMNSAAMPKITADLGDAMQYPI